MNARQRRQDRRARARRASLTFDGFMAGMRAAIVRAFVVPAPLLSAGPRLGESWETETDRLRTHLCAPTGN